MIRCSPQQIYDIELKRLRSYFPNVKPPPKVIPGVHGIDTVLEDLFAYFNRIILSLEKEHP